MNKVLVLIVCLLCLMEITNAAKQCNITFFPSLIPTCNYTTTEDGEVIEGGCVNHGTRTLTRKNPVQKIEGYVDEMTFNGKCKCVYTLYSNGDFTGDKTKGKVKTNTSQVVNTWPNQNGSWKVRCRF